MTSTFRRFVRTTCLAGVLLVAACSPAQPASQQPPRARITLEDCQVSSPGLPARLASRCGKLPVFEDRSAGSGRMIELNIAILPATSRNPAPDPLFFLAGGPGQAATETYLPLAPAFARINQKRAIVLVDQRGTGKSNPLQCPTLEPSTAELDPQQVRQNLETCLNKLDADPKFYTTSAAVADLEQVRQALGYSQVNLYGVSYGTRVALTYLHDYPGAVRAAILDGVVPQDEVLGAHVAPDAQRALDHILERCASMPACQAAFPRTKQEFTQLVASLEEKPIQVILPDPRTGESRTMLFTRNELATAVHLLSYTPETASLLPLLIHAAAEIGDYTGLVAQYLMANDSLNSSVSSGLNYAVLCAEDVPFLNIDQARQASQGTYLGEQQIDELLQICQTWPHGSVPPDFKQAIVSATPTLLLSGEDDPVTPPENAERVSRSLPNSLSLVASGQGHNVIYRGCFPDIATRFIESGSLAGLETGCVQEIAAAPFFLNYSGPQP